MDATAPAFALVGTALRNRFDRQTPGARAGIVTANACQAGIDHVADAGNREGSLRDIRGDHNFAMCGRSEDALLIADGEPPEERHDFRLVSEASFEEIARFPNIPFSGHENQNIPATGLAHDLFGSGDSGIDKGHFAIFFRRWIKWGVNHFHGKEPAGNLNNRGVVKGAGEGFRVDGGRSDDELQIGSAPEQTFQMAKQKIDVQTSLVCFVDDDGVNTRTKVDRLEFRRGACRPS